MAGRRQEAEKEPSPQQKAEQRKKGHVSRTPSLTSSFLLLVGVLALYGLGGLIYRELAELAQGYLGHFWEEFATQEGASDALRTLLLLFLRIVAPLFGILFISAILINIYQVGWVVSWDSLKMRWRPKKLFQSETILPQFLRLAILVALFLEGTYRSYSLFVNRVDLTPLQFFVALSREIFFLAAEVAAVLLILGIVEDFYRRWKWRQLLRATEEGSLEMQQADQQIKRRRKWFNVAQSNQHYSRAADADLIITDGKGTIVAFKYMTEKMLAPVCVAKGEDEQGKQIALFAIRKGVPVIQRAELVKRLFVRIEVGDYLPPEFYQDLAELLAEVYREKKR